MDSPTRRAQFHTFENWIGRGDGQTFLRGLSSKQPIERIGRAAAHSVYSAKSSEVTSKSFATFTLSRAEPGVRLAEGDPIGTSFRRGLLSRATMTSSPTSARLTRLERCALNSAMLYFGIRRSPYSSF